MIFPFETFISTWTNPKLTSTADPVKVPLLDLAVGVGVGVGVAVLFGAGVFFPVAALVGAGLALCVGAADFEAAGFLTAAELPVPTPSPDADAPSCGGVTARTAPKPPAVPAAINRNLFNF